MCEVPVSQLKTEDNGMYAFSNILVSFWVMEA